MAEQTVIGEFVEIIEISSSVTGNGNIVPTATSGRVIVVTDPETGVVTGFKCTYASNISFDIIPASEQYIASISKDAQTVTVTKLNGATQTESIANITEDGHSITATFAQRNAYFDNTESGGITYRSGVALPSTISLGKTVNGRTWNAIVKSFPTGKTININLTEALSSAVNLPFDSQSYAWYFGGNLVETIQSTGTYTYKALPLVMSGTFQKYYLGLENGLLPNGQFRDESWTGNTLVPTAPNNSANPFTAVSSNFQIYVTEFAFKDNWSNNSTGGASATISIKYAGATKGPLKTELPGSPDGTDLRIRTAVAEYNLTNHVKVKVTLETGEYQEDPDGNSGTWQTGPRVTVKVEVIAINR